MSPFTEEWACWNWSDVSTGDVVSCASAWTWYHAWFCLSFTDLTLDNDLLFCKLFTLFTIFLISFQVITGKNSVAAMVCKHFQFAIESWHLFSEIVYDTIRIKRANMITILQKTYKGKLMFLVWLSPAILTLFVNVVYYRSYFPRT
jgi:hypothetical protein